MHACVLAWGWCGWAVGVCRWVGADPSCSHMSKRRKNASERVLLSNRTGLESSSSERREREMLLVLSLVLKQQVFFSSIFLFTVYMYLSEVQSVCPFLV